MTTAYLTGDKPRPPKPDLVFKTCDWCNGTGTYTLPDRAVTCPNCRGDGGWWAIGSRTAANALSIVAAGVLWGGVVWLLVDRWIG